MSTDLFELAATVAMLITAASIGYCAWVVALSDRGR